MASVPAPTTKQCRAAFTRVAPLAASQLVIANDFVADLPDTLWDGDDQTAQMLEAGRALDALHLLPAPFPLEEILGPRDLRHVMLLYGIGGLSYGNVSAAVPGPRPARRARSRRPGVLDERERGRQVGSAHHRRAHLAGARIRRRSRPRWCCRFRPIGRTAAFPSTRSNTG